MMNNIIVALSILVIYQFVQVGAYICPNSIKPMSNFEPEKWVGVWYNIEHSRNNITGPFKCLSCNVTLVEKNKYYGTCTGIIIDGNQTFTFENYVRVVGNSNKGRILARTVYGKNEDIYYANIITDYDTIQFAYGCNVEEKTVHSWVMGRKRKPGAEFFEKAHNLLIENGLDPAGYQRANQDNCPEP